MNPGHTPETKGKRSPDGMVREYAWTREVARKASDLLTQHGIANLIAAADKEVDSLTLPVKTANHLCVQCGVSNVLFISIHCNAAGNGKEWTTARGWEVWTTRGKTKSDKLATYLYEAAKEIYAGHKLRTDFTDGDPDKEKDFYVLKHTSCPAVLIEHFFMDNKEDAAYLMTDECKRKAGEVILKAVQMYIKGA